MNNYLEFIKAYAAESTSLKTWGLSIIGASLLAILSTSYVKPTAIGWRMIYLIFIPAWILSALSVYNGMIVSRRLVAAINASLRSDKSDLLTIASKINDHYAAQLALFNYSVVCYMLWLLLYLVWWLDIKSNNYEN